MEENQEEITGSIRALAAWKRHSQAYLAEVLGLSAVTVAQRLNGRLAWTKRDLRLLSKHYGVPEDKLTAGPASWLELPVGGDELGSGANVGYPDLLGSDTDGLSAYAQSESLQFAA